MTTTTTQRIAFHFNFEKTAIKGLPPVCVGKSLQYRTENFHPGCEVRPEGVFVTKVEGIKKGHTILWEEPFVRLHGCDRLDEYAAYIVARNYDLKMSSLLSTLHPRNETKATRHLEQSLPEKVKPHVRTRLVRFLEKLAHNCYKQEGALYLFNKGSFFGESKEEAGNADWYIHAREDVFFESRVKQMQHTVSFFLRVFATKDITKGEEITFSAGAGERGFICLCLACRGAAAPEALAMEVKALQQ